MRSRSPSRPGASVAEIALVLALSAIVLGIAVPRVRYLVERRAVRGAVADVVTTLSTARQVAVSSGGGVSLTIDSSAGTIHLLRRGDTIAVRPLGSLYGVTLRTNRDSIAFDARGLGSGAANLTFVVARGSTTDTVVVSRLGRVRW